MPDILLVIAHILLKLKDLRMKKWKSFTSSFDTNSVLVKMATTWRSPVSWFSNSRKMKVSGYVGVIWIYVKLICLYVGIGELGCNNLSRLSSEHKEKWYLLKRTWNNFTRCFI